MHNCSRSSLANNKKSTLLKAPSVHFDTYCETDSSRNCIPGPWLELKHTQTLLSRMNGYLTVILRTEFSEIQKLPAAYLESPFQCLWHSCHTLCLIFPSFLHASQFNHNMPQANLYPNPQLCSELCANGCPQPAILELKGLHNNHLDCMILSLPMIGSLQSLPSPFIFVAAKIIVI